MSLATIANQLAGMNENIILIFAFNGTGKTQLSVAYKDETKKSNNNKHAGVYYNAFSEDLFVWDNDEENDGANIKLNILQSSLNQFHSFFMKMKALSWISLQRIILNIATSLICTKILKRELSRLLSLSKTKKKPP